MLLAQDQPQLALRLLGRLLAVAKSQGRTGSIIEIQALQALALADTGGQAAAEELAGTLALAARQGYVRVFADEGPPMAALLGQVATAHRDGQPTARQVPLGHLAAVLRACAPTSRSPETGRPGRTSIPGLTEPLTAREMQVLHLLAAGAPNQQIAADLVVTLATVKKHVTHLLGKLGAANRTEVVARARQLGLIDLLAPLPRLTHGPFPAASSPSASGQNPQGVKISSSRSSGRVGMTAKIIGAACARCSSAAGNR